MPYQDPRLNFTALALRQLRELSLNRQNLVSQVLRELVEMQDHNADHGVNDNPFMQDCSLFQTHSKSLTKWGVKITYGVCQDKIDIVCIEVEPSPLPPSGPQAVSIRSFSANDNYEFVQHPIVEVHIAWTDLKKVGAWLAAAERIYAQRLMHRIVVKNSFTVTVFMNVLGASYLAALPCKEKYTIKRHLKLHPSDLERCASRILLGSPSYVFGPTKALSAISMSSILIGLTMRSYDESMWKLGATSSLKDSCAVKERDESFAMGDWSVGFRDIAEFDWSCAPNKCETSVIDQSLHPHDALEDDDWCTLDPDLGAFSWPGAMTSPAGPPPFHLN
ncbi:hypothetical protein ELG72_37880 [Rhizobium leguminosarum]|uniref:hypothetical protein n=1 Tax=Rhizobium leguminosarum TaxID=384 RepID=UPI00102F533A|nr:hypothetical protein [Rhizobium leguminosarum]TBF87914.1 hypothetical protein ELG82_37650 [Rhizobium leguminosarum]TBG07105.1 hypothetical protein ELG80_37045 [Rhizobium leguminosarum]TBG07578.1 hypothetical protein ELG81_37780 [Rhizobium leguminosarum]TBG30789.1 hypothetical protein ELG75_36745 [Rhizobium leguminosarum]TBG50030.1 hypothetical protein ELG72_37880 [Rhizobium leguminosarum]